MALRLLVAVTLAIFSLGAPARAEGVILRISTENTADHVQTKAVARFAAELQRRAGPRLQVSHHFGATLFRDHDVVKALRQGKVEMAVPGTWQLDRLEPSVGIFLLPALYGRPTSIDHRPLRDGDVGHEVDRRIERNLDLHVLGRWIDLGHAHVFGVRKIIRSHDDLAGLRIRVAGGEANLLRLTALGAQPRVIPWPDLPRAMDDGTVDGILTTYETVASARLWEKGVTSVYEDSEYFPNYIPLLSSTFWDDLPSDLKTLMSQVWEETVGLARADAEAAQRQARAECIEHGVVVTVAEPSALADQRRRLMAIQPEVVSALGIDPALVNRAMAVLGDPR